jgi:hypothetical protein
MARKTRRMKTVATAGRGAPQATAVKAAAAARADGPEKTPRKLYHINKKHYRTPSSDPFTRHKVFAVLCPFTHDYFIADEEDVYTRPLISKITNQPIPADQEYVQSLSIENRLVWSGDQIGRVIRTWLETEKELGEPLFEPTDFEVPTLPWTADAFKQFPTESDVKEFLRLPPPSGFKQANVDEWIDGALKSESRALETKYNNEFYQDHRISFDLWRGNAVVFQAGLGGMVMDVIPLAQTQVQLQQQGGSVKDTVKTAIKIASALTIVKEILELIGRLLGWGPPRWGAVLDKIQAALEKGTVLAAIQKFIKLMKSDFAGALLELLGVLKGEFSLIDLLKSLFDLGWSAILWGLAKIAAKFTPAGWVITAVEVGIWIASFGVKIAGLVL